MAMEAQSWYQKWGVSLRLCDYALVREKTSATADGACQLTCNTGR